MPIIYQIRLLGPVQIEKEGIPIRDFESRKSLALLGYLVRQEQPVSRSHLAGLLWGDKSEARGRRNLSRELSQLSSHLPDCFQADYHTIQFLPSVACWVDTLAFTEGVKSESGPQPSKTPVDAARADQALLSMADPAATPAVPETQLSNLAEAVALYQGQFMSGFYLDGCPEFETWLVREQEAWQQQVTGILDCLTVYHGARREYNQAQLHVKHWLALEPWQEEAHRYTMILLARMGKRGDALVQYEICCRILAEELAVEPEPETTVLYEQIRTGTWEGERAPEISTLLAEPENPLPELPPCPYRGLFAFGEEDAPFFYGREAFSARLVEAEERVKTHPVQMSPPEHEFLQASIAWRDQRVLEREVQLARELDQVRALAQEQQRRAESERQRADAQVKATRRLRWLAVGLAVMFLLAVGAGLLLIVQ